MRLLVRSLMCCVLATGARAQWYPSSNVTVVYPPQAPSPTTVIMLNDSPPPPRFVEVREERVPARPTTFLIAFKDSVVRMANQYWVSGRTLYYVTADHERMSAPVNTVDRVLSKRLNSERNVAFILPPEQRMRVAQARLVRHTGSAARKRCDCGPAQRAGASRSSPSAPVEK
jgi:hypothetical protein